MSASGPQTASAAKRLLEELRKAIRSGSPLIRTARITETFDVMARPVQPFVADAAAKLKQLHRSRPQKGQPTAIFEDRLAGLYHRRAPGTGQPKRPKQERDVDVSAGRGQAGTEGRHPKALGSGWVVEMVERSRADMFGSVDKDVAVHLANNSSRRSFEGIDQLTPGIHFH